MCTATSMVTGMLGMTNNFMDQIGSTRSRHAEWMAREQNWAIDKMQADDKQQQFEARLALNTFQVRERMAQNQMAAESAKQEIGREMEAARADAALAASEAGVSGASVDRLLNSFRFAADRKRGVQDKNLEYQQEEAKGTLVEKRLESIQSPIYYARTAKPGLSDVSLVSAAMSGIVSGSGQYLGDWAAKRDATKAGGAWR